MSIRGLRRIITRRRFLAGSLATCGGVGLYTWQWEPHWLRVVERPLPVRHLSDELQGARLVQLSDLHIGPRVTDSHVRRVFEVTRSLAPDIVVITGDFISYEPGILAHLERMLVHIPHGRMATLGVLGNHDFGFRWQDHTLSARIVERADHAGLRILRNEVSTHAGLHIVGLDDLWGGNFRPELAFASLPDDAAAIALSHNPDTVDLPGWSRFQGWVLCGHTHGGQCKPPFLPPPMLPVKNRRYTAGEFELTGHRRMYINCGIGHLLKVRFNVRPEITLFQLQTQR